MVGPVLLVGRVTDAVVAAIRKLNPGTMVIERGAYLRVLSPQRCSLTREAIEAELGEAFHLPGDLEQIMPSFKGRLTLSDSLVEWAFA
jgi:hypothetical protein